MKGTICRLLALCAVIAAPAAAGQNAQKPIAPDPPPPAFELIPEAYIQLDWRAYPESPVTPGTGTAPIQYLRRPQDESGGDRAVA